MNCSPPMQLHAGTAAPTDAVTETVFHARNARCTTCCAVRMTGWCGRRSLFHPRPRGRARLCGAPEDAGGRAAARSGHPDAGLFREAAHHRGLERPDQRPASGRKLRHQRGPAPGASPAAANQRARLARRAPSFSTWCRRSTLPTWWPGAPSARAPPSRSRIASWRPARRARSDSRTAPTATSRLPSTRSRPRPRATISFPSPRPATSAVFKTAGNEDCHVILRGGKKPNYDAESVNAACQDLAAAGPAPAGHDRLFPRQFQQTVSERRSKWRHDVARQIAGGDHRIIGRDDRKPPQVRAARICVPASRWTMALSITDACIGWDETVPLLRELAAAVQARRIKAPLDEQ